MELLILLFFVYVLYIAPLMVSAEICRKRNRNIAKGVFVTLFFGWAATAGLWLALKRRDPKSLMLY